MVMNNKGEFVTKPMKGPHLMTNGWRAGRCSASLPSCWGSQRSVPWMHTKRTFAI